LRRSRVVRGRLRAWGGRPLAGREITVTAKVRADGTAPVVAGRALTGGRGRFRIRVGPGASRVLHVDSPGTGGLQGARRKLNLRVPWSSTLRIRPRSLAPGGRIRLSGRLRLRGALLPRSGKRVELQAFDAGRWRVFAQPRARRRGGGRFRTSYKLQRTFGPRTFRFRARVRPEAAYPYTLGYSRVVRVRVRVR
jgi:hypothetical protein